MKSARVVTSRDTFQAVAETAPPTARIPVVVTFQADPFDAYRRAREDAPSFYIETSGGRSGWGYFGVTPDQLYEVSESGTLETITNLLSSEMLVRGDCNVPHPGGFFGWLSYDVARDIESLPETTVDDRNLPRAQLGRYSCLAAWQEPHNGETTLQIIATPRIHDDPDEAYDRGRERAVSLARAASDGDPTVGPAPATTDHLEFTSSCERAAYADRVRRVKQYIRDGDSFQANISHRLEAPAAVHPVDAYAALRRINPAPYSGLIEFPGIDLVSASPELLLDCDEATVMTEPIAGTRPRGTTAKQDHRFETDLQTDEKERAEHAMLVDLKRNDLGKVSKYGSVTVDEYRRVDRYSEVMHLVSRISGTRRDDCTLADVIAAVFPGGTITGAPKPRTMEIIDEVEQRRRGPYTGSMAAIGFDGRATLNIIIRTLVRYEDEYHLRVGGGIVHDSVPDREYDETLAKARALVNAIDTAISNDVDMEVRSQK
ncbi:anthranilate synthase component 1 [Halalkalicoccus paucihalophilus]|uniref:anthranilate synthase n=1 Tax=Halalkalicoccus paucihalophilus TaxID=1008153 RepID=A0A151A8U9_9EURY|nr:aminodeoxychorismate synthase, component I [Halalkalicoccus paucihalophilus]KYH24118.1 anthranilate synthase component 1 [Halalkalicoccus paucihalophilus]